MILPGSCQDLLLMCEKYLSTLFKYYSRQIQISLVHCRTLQDQPNSSMWRPPAVRLSALRDPQNGPQSTKGPPTDRHVRWTLVVITSPRRHWITRLSYLASYAPCGPWSYYQPWKLNTIEESLYLPVEQKEKTEHRDPETPLITQLYSISPRTITILIGSNGRAVRVCRLIA